MDTQNVLTSLIGTAGLVLGYMGGRVARSAWRDTNRIKRVEWLTSQHKYFFFEPNLRDTRELLDCRDAAPPPDEVATMIAEESPELFEYLNFFEHLAYLETKRHLEQEEIDAMFGYYLDKLRSVEVIWNVINYQGYGFEHLRTMLNRRPARKKNKVLRLKNLLFVYGTLDPAVAPAEVKDVVSKFVSHGKGAVRGKLYQLEGYPGIKLNESGGMVKGTVYEVPDTPDAWDKLDAYEEVHEALFTRKVCSVELDSGGRMNAYVYEYAREIS